MRKIVFYFTANNILGRKILAETNHTIDSSGNPILKTKRYNLTLKGRKVSVNRVT